MNSVAINVSRAIGPAIAGVLVAAVGPWLVFSLNALSYIGIIAVLVQWKREHRKSTLPAERFFTAIRVGMRFVMHTRTLQVVLVRGLAFFIFASATWSLFPLIVRARARAGTGNLRPAAHLHRHRRGVGRDGAAAAARANSPATRWSPARASLYALAALALAHVQSIGLLAVAMLATGVAWISILSALQVSAQMTLPAWVRARGLAAFVVIFMGGMALGSILWGQVASRIGIPGALTAAAAGMVLAIALTWRFKLGQHEVLDFTPSMDWPLPVLAETPEPDVPVMVTIRYSIRPDKRAEFVAAMQGVREMRRRNGAYFWQLFHDAEDPTRFVEVFMDESWVEHLRQHERASVADREILDRAKQFMVEKKVDEIVALARRSRIVSATPTCPRAVRDLATPCTCHPGPAFRMSPLSGTGKVWPCWQAGVKRDSRPETQQRARRVPQQLAPLGRIGKERSTRFSTTP